MWGGGHLLYYLHSSTAVITIVWVLAKDKHLLAKDKYLFAKDKSLLAKDKCLFICWAVCQIYFLKDTFFSKMIQDYKKKWKCTKTIHLYPHSIAPHCSLPIQCLPGGTPPADQVQRVRRVRLRDLGRVPWEHDHAQR